MITAQSSKQVEEKCMELLHDGSVLSKSHNVSAWLCVSSLLRRSYFTLKFSENPGRLKPAFRMQHNKFLGSFRNGAD